MKQSLSEILLQALLLGDIHKILEIANNYLGYPVMLVDSEYNLIAHCPNEKIEDPLWDALHEFGTTPPNFINKLHMEDMMKLGVSQVEPYYLDYGFLENHPRILMNLISDGKCYGYLLVICRDNSKKMFEDVSLIGSVIMIELQKKHTEISVSEDYQIMFLRHLFDEKSMSQERLNNWKQYLEVSLTAPYYVASCSYKAKGDKVFTQNYIKTAIRKIYPELLFMTNGKQFVFLLTNINKEDELYFYIDMIDKTFSEYGLCFGISNQFMNLENAYVHLEQSKYALSIARERGVKNLKYKECMLNQISAVIYASLPQESYVHEAINRIRKYDDENGTEYLITLKKYVNSLFNMKKTVEELHIHRNTLPHRLDMIEKIGEIDLEDKDTVIVLLLNFLWE